MATVSPPAPALDGRPSLAARLEAPATAAALHRLLDRIERIDATVGALEDLLGQAPGFAALLVDMLDEAYDDAGRAGFDLDLSVRRGATAALRLAETLDEARIEGLVALMHSGMLDPRVVGLVGVAGEALVRCHEDDQARSAPDEMGPIDALRALRDPPTRRGFAFVLNFLRHFGHAVEARRDRERPARGG